MDPNAFSDALNVLFGDGAHELIAKMNPDGADLSTHEKKRQKRQAQVGLASNILGIGAGAQGLYSAGHELKGKLDARKGKSNPKPAEVKPKNPEAKKVAGVRGKLRAVGESKKSWAKNPKTALYLAGGAVGLQAANLGGDLVANRVLAREAKKEVKKDIGAVTPEGQIRRKLHNPEVDGLPLGARGQLIKLTVNNKDKIKSGSKKTADVVVPGVRKTAIVAVETGKKTKEKLVSKAMDMELTTEISKVNADKRQVFGWASIVEKDGVPVVDLQGDYISVDEVEKAAYEYVQKSRKGGNMHARDGEAPVHVSDMIESFVVTPEKKEKLGLPESVPTGWWVGFKIHDDDTWDQIKSGKRPQLSIHGRGKRQEI